MTLGTKVEDWKWIDIPENDLSNQQNDFDLATSESEKDYKYFEDSTFNVIDGFFISKKNPVHDSKIGLKSKEVIETFSSATVTPIINQSPSAIIQAGVFTKTTSSFPSETNPSTSTLDWPTDTPSNKEMLHTNILKNQKLMS